MKKGLLITMIFCNWLFTGCLKDEPLNDYSKIDPIILIPNSNWPSNSPFNSYSYLSIDGPKEIKIYARISWEKTLSEDLIVTFQKNESIVADVNSLRGTAYVFMPENGYSINNLQIIIPAGQRDAYVPVTINPSLVPASKNYILAFTIKDAQDQLIASNLKTILLPIEIQ